MSTIFCTTAYKTSVGRSFRVLSSMTGQHHLKKHKAGFDHNPCLNFYCSQFEYRNREIVHFKCQAYRNGMTSEGSEVSFIRDAQAL
jgi:hypothetical protein